MGVVIDVNFLNVNVFNELVFNVSFAIAGIMCGEGDVVKLGNGIAFGINGNRGGGGSLRIDREFSQLEPIAA